MVNRFISFILVMLLFVSCNVNSNIEHYGDSAYEQYKIDSIKTCTNNINFAKTLAMHAFNRDYESPKSLHKKVIDGKYSNELESYVIDIEIDNKSVDYKDTVRYQVKVWEEFNKETGKESIFYTEKQIMTSGPL